MKMFKHLTCVFIFVSCFLFTKSEIKKDFYNESKYNQNKSSVYDVRDFGAVGDGKTITTKAFQEAIDQCNRAGGGRVLVSGGTFVIGTIFLKSNISLRMKPEQSHWAVRILKTIVPTQTVLCIAANL